MCTITSGVATLGCRDYEGGAANVYIMNDTDDIVYTYGTNSIITNITFTGVTQSIYKFAQPEEVISYTIPGVHSKANQNTIYTQTLLINIYGLNAASIEQIENLNRGAYKIFIEDNTGRYFLMGENGPVQTESSEGGLGQLKEDMNGQILTFTYKSKNMPKEVDASVITALLP